jgi:hypothetical protein
MDTGYHAGRVESLDADDSLRDHCTLPRVDHVDAHLLRLDRPADRTAEQWAREILEHTSAATRARLFSGWAMLGLRLRPGDPATIAGWPIADSDMKHVRLQTDSRLGLTGQLVTQVRSDGIVFATFARLGNPVVRALWARVLPTHLTIVRSLLRGAAERTG